MVRLGILLLIASGACGVRGAVAWLRIEPGISPKDFTAGGWAYWAPRAGIALALAGLAVLAVGALT